MIEKLQGKLPIEISERNETIWDENGLVNYSELLSAIDKFMAQVMMHNKANSVRAVYDEDIISRRANANKFLDVIHKVSKIILSIKIMLFLLRVMGANFWRLIKSNHKTTK
jgi:thymidylate synthase